MTIDCDGADIVRNPSGSVREYPVYIILQFHRDVQGQLGESLDRRRLQQTQQQTGRHRLEQWALPRLASIDFYPTPRRPRRNKTSRQSSLRSGSELPARIEVNSVGFRVGQTNADWTDSQRRPYINNQAWDFSIRSVACLHLFMRAICFVWNIEQFGLVKNNKVVVFVVKFISGFKKN